MQLNHLNLVVSDVLQNQAFFQTYFGFQPITKGSPVLTVLRDDTGLVLTLTNFGKATEVTYPPDFHIGFIQPSQEAVNAINQRFKDDGFDVESPKVMHGSWTFYLRAPGGFLIEVLYLTPM